MGLSTPPPRWDTVLEKPTTVSGFGITDALTNAVTSQIAGNGINISGATGAVTVNANNTVGAIGTYAVGYLNSNAVVTRNSNYAGASLTGKWFNDAGYQFTSYGFSGTWRAFTGISVGTNHENSSVMSMRSEWLFQRIA